MIKLLLAQGGSEGEDIKFQVGDRSDGQDAGEEHAEDTTKNTAPHCHNIRSVAPKVQKRRRSGAIKVVGQRWPQKGKAAEDWPHSKTLRE